MSIATNLERILTSKDDIKNAIISKGVTVLDSDKIDVYADKIYQIKQGSEYTLSSLTITDDTEWRTQDNVVLSYVKADYSSFKNRITTLENEIIDLNSQITEKENKITELQNQIDYDEDLINDLRNEISTLETQKSALENELNELKTKVNSMTDLNVTENGTYTPTFGYKKVTVNVDTERHIVTSKTITENGIYNSSGNEVWNRVTVNVPQTGVSEMQSLEVTDIGTYQNTEIPYSSVTVPSEHFYKKYTDEDGNTYIINEDGEKIITYEKPLGDYDVLVTYSDGREETFTYENGIIPSNAFINKRITSVIIGNKITSIGGSAFDSCTSLTSVTIGNSVTSIGDWAFYGCSGLTSITIPNGVTSIDDNAFHSCSNLTSVEIPNSVTSIGSYAFSNVPTEGTLICDDDWYNNLSSENINNLGNVYYWYSKPTPPVGDYDVLLTYEDGREEKYTYEDGIIPKNAFATIEGIVSVIIGDGITTIGEDAFQWCTDLISVTIGSGVTTIGNEAFYHCHKLANINIPETVTSIGNTTFASCYALTSITIPNGVTRIGGNVFSGCSSLSDVTIGSGVTRIGEYAFFSATSLTSIVLPNSLTEIASDSFASCKNLSSITIPPSVTSIGVLAFDGLPTEGTLICDDDWFNSLTSGQKQNMGVVANWYSKIPSVGNYEVLLINNDGTQETHFYFDGKISSFAFASNSKVKQVVIGKSITNIATYAFSNCSNLTNITIPNSVTTIGGNAFNNVPTEGTLYCDDDWFNSLSLTNKTNLGNLSNWTRKPLPV